jgi:hypothetical protein
MQPIRGAKPGTGAGGKRKAEDELSQNPHTSRGRARVAAMTDVEKTIERAKNADRQAISRATTKMKSSATYQNASSEEQKNMEKLTRKRIMSIR